MSASRIAYRAALSGYFGLFTLLLVGTLTFSPPLHFPVWLALPVLLVPLLFPLRGLLAGRPYTFAWTSLLSLAYLLHGIDGLVATPQDWLPVLEMGLSALLYTAAVLYVRLRSREEQAQRAADAGE